MTRRWLLRVMLPALLCAMAPAWAHKPSDSYLVLQAQGGRIELRWDIALRDLDRELALDADDDGRLSWGEVRGRWSEIERYAFERVSLQVEGRSCAIAASGKPQLDRHSDGSYVVLTRSL
ncbi:MAG TPA: HupE/UreJ family protein, partial [Methylibium sp.]